jgi:3-hydroxymyristoyl/3-hydroxydecanoyl-(acyl carrier protein) dehydratase
MWQSAEIRFASDHPTAAGHFPGHPIIPGALLLDEVVLAIAGAEAPAGEIVISSAKFLAPIRPGDVVSLRWRSRADGQISFECRLADNERLAASGTLRLGPISP